MVTLQNKVFCCAIVLTVAAVSPTLAEQTVRYVDADNPTPASPFTEGWASAAATIQDALDVAAAGDLILVTNGIYSKGGALTPGYSLSNRVCITKALTVRAVSADPAETVIVGAPSPVTGGVGTNAVRGVYMVANSALIGFTVSNGFTYLVGNDPNERRGGGIYAMSHWILGQHSQVISNCVVTGNRAGEVGGGIYQGSAYACTLTGNEAYGSGGAGAGISLLYDCLIAGNHATNNHGGGTYGGRLTRCIVSNNMAATRGGGAYQGFSTTA